MNIDKARSVLGIQGPSFSHDIKFAYINTLMGMLEGQLEVSKLNEAYHLLMKNSQAGGSLSIDEILLNLNELSLPNLVTLRSLVKTRFNLTSEVLPLTAIDDLEQDTYFQFSSNAYVKQTFKLKVTSSSIEISDISNGGVPGSETVDSISIKVLDWGRMVNSGRLVSSIIQRLYSPEFHSCKVSKGWHWGKLFNFTFNCLKSNKMINGEEMFYICNHKFVRDIAAKEPVFHSHVDGATLQITYTTTKALKSFNPYTIEDQFKPLSKAPKHWSRKMVIRALANGQYTELRGHLDGKGVEVNPIDILSDWVTQTRNTKACSETDGLVTFSTITDTTYSLKFEPKNRYPALDLHQLMAVSNAA